jgi:poly-beta-1,6-N-acetyl-D-glucosamine biosynthesis protein PgaD
MEIIDKPEKKSLLRKITEAGFTVFMWGVWSYLLFPILNIIFWLIGIRIVYLELFAGATYLDILNVLKKAGWSVFAIFMILRCWGLYNYWKFGRLNRRTSVATGTGEKTLSEYFQIPEDVVKELKARKEVRWPLV